MTFLVMLTLWNVLYSPYGATERTLVALTVVAVRVFESHSTRERRYAATAPGGRGVVEVT